MNFTATSTTDSPLLAACNDAAFGPGVSSAACRGGFDFTLAFEQYLFGIAPSATLLLAAPLRLAYLFSWKQQKKGPHGVDGGAQSGKKDRRSTATPVIVTGGRTLQLAKVVGFGILAVLQLAEAGLCGSWDGGGGDGGYGAWRTLRAALVAAAVLGALASIAGMVLSHVEHGRAARPSTVINAYLLVSVLVDAAVLRTLWLLRDQQQQSGMVPTTTSDITRRIVGAVAAVHSAAFAARVTLLVLEAVEKGRFLAPSGPVVRSPEETSGLIGRGLVWWMMGLLRTGYRRVLAPDDLYPVDESMSSKALSYRFSAVWETNASSPRKHKLIRACAVTLRWAIAGVVLPRLCLLAFTICQPLLLDRFLNFLQDEEQSVNIGYGLVGAYAIVYIGIAVFGSLYWHQSYRTTTMLRGILMTAVFDKTLTISNTAAVDNDAAVTLMSTDVDRIVRAARDIHELWANLVQIAIATWLLSIQIGYAAVAPIVISILTVVASVLVGPMASRFQVQWIEVVQKRVGITSSILGHMKSVKMMGLTAKLAEVIHELRLEETNAALPSRLMAAILSTVAQLPLLLSPAAAFSVFTIVARNEGSTLDASRMFASLSLIVLLTQPLFFLFQVILDISTALGCFGRIEKFLEAQARNDTRHQKSCSRISISKHPESGGHDRPAASGGSEIELIELNKGAASTNNIPDVDFDLTVERLTLAWPDGARPIVRDLSVSVARGRLTMVVGPVASGKSTLLKGLLGEVPSTEGSVSLGRGRLAWCDQNPWLINDTVKKNIIGYSDLDAQLYSQVVAACALEKDFEQLPNGDDTVIGSKGITLSGGQKQRIALARAVYSRPEIAILDDLLSGLDNETARHVAMALLERREGLLRKWGTTVVLATMSAQFLPMADQVIALAEGGTVADIGSFGELVRRDGGYVKAAFSTTQTQDRVKDESPAAEDAVASSSATKTASSSSPSPAKVAVRASVTKDDKKEQSERAATDKKRQVGDMTIYSYYFGTVGPAIVAGLLVLELTAVFLTTFPTVWLKWWSDANNASPNARDGYYLGGYWGFQVSAAVASALLTWFVFAVIAVRSGVELHSRLLRSVMRAPLRFFAGTDTGSLVTRFSQDIGLVDLNLPLALLMTISCFFTVIGKAGLIASATGYVAISFPFILAVFYFLQRGYLRTSRQLRFLDLEEKAPVYSQFLETIPGRTTIRAFGWSQPAKDRNETLVDRAQRPFYLLLMVQQWLTLVLDLVTTGIALLVVGISMGLRGSSSVSPGFTGVSLVQLIALTETLKLLIQFWTSLETSIGAVARIRAFEQETPDEDISHRRDSVLPDRWPGVGAVTVDNVSASYTDNLDNKALNGVSLAVKPGEKLGICGRTGSGKSSLLLLFLRLLDPLEGSVIIDGIDVTTVPREKLRTRFITVAQDQFFLPGTVRENVDPHGVSTSEEIEAALSKVLLWDTVRDRGGLDARLEDDWLSQGQKQLFFLARAILRKEHGKIVLLDEVSSSLDHNTEALMQQVIHEEFGNHSIIAIAHRLDTISGFDRVLVLDNGRIVEEGNPRSLLEQHGSHFRALWEATHMADSRIE